MGPDAGEAVGLELDADGRTLGADVALATLQVADQVLDVVAVLVRHDVSLGQRPALGAEALLELVVEPEVEVDVGVERTVERPDGRRGGSAGRVHPAVVEHGVGRLVGGATLGEGVGPVVLDAVDEADDPAVLALVGVLAGLALLGQLGAVLVGDEARVRDAGQRAGISAEQQVGEQQDDADAAASEGDAAGATDTTTVEDLAWVESSVGIEDHGGRAPLPVQREAPARAGDAANMRGIVGHGR